MTYRVTSRAALDGRSDDEIARDSVLARPLRIGAFAIWCLWVSFGSFGVGALLSFVSAKIDLWLKIYAALPFVLSAGLLIGSLF